MKLYKEYGHYRRETGFWLSKQYFEFRKDPVPGIHKRKFKGHYRKIDNIKEKKSWLSFKNQLKEIDVDKIKMRRTNNTLPDSYINSCSIGIYYIHGWKRTKKRKQWM